MQMDQAEKSTLSKRCVPVYTKPPLLAPKTLFGVPQGRALGPICFHCWLVFAAEAVISSAADEARTSHRTIASASRPPKTHTGTFYASAVYLRYKYIFPKRHVSYSHTRMSFRINILKPVKGLKWIRPKEKIRRKMIRPIHQFDSFTIPSLYVRRQMGT